MLMMKAKVFGCSSLFLVFFWGPRGWSLAPPVRRTSALSDLGQRGVVVVTGPAERKVRKKQRRSRSPLLYPAKDPRSGQQCWLRLGPADTEEYGRWGSAVSVVVTEVHDDGELIIVSPKRTVSPRKALPETAKFLNHLKVGEPLRVTYLRHLRKDVVLASTEVYRHGANGVLRKCNAVLRLDGDDRPAIPEHWKDGIDCFVLNPEPNSGRLTLSMRPPDKGELKRTKDEARLNKQIKRGTLKVGATRVATVAAVDEDAYHLDAGGLKASISKETTTTTNEVASSDTPQSDTQPEQQLQVGDKIWVKVLRLPDDLAPALLERLPPGDHQIVHQSPSLVAPSRQQENNDDAAS